MARPRWPSAYQSRPRMLPPGTYYRNSGAPTEQVDPNATEFTGTVHWVQLDIDEAAEDLDHLITPEELLRVAMARQ